MSTTTVPALELKPARNASGTVVVPGSKSISNRALLLAALAQGSTELSGLLDSDDTSVMLQSLGSLGINIQPGAAGLCLSQGPDWPVASAELFLGNAGTAFRPLTAVLAMLGGSYSLSGVKRMHERPIKDLVEALQSMGCAITYKANHGYPPLSIGPASLKPMPVVKVRGNISSQFLTALLLAAPLAAAQISQDVRIEVDGDLISKPYIHITLELMRHFGVLVSNNNWRSFVVPANARYTSPGRYHIEGDASSASYFLGLATIAGGPIRIEGIGAGSIQGDLAFAEVVQAMGARVEFSDHALEVSGLQVAQGQRLKAFDYDFNNIPDAAMTAAVLALYADGPCHLRNIASWRVKETDRIAAMQAELQALGARVSATADSLSVEPMQPGQWRPASIKTYDDHRMAMCFSLACFGPVAVNILDPGCVAKTYPGYFDDFLALLKG